jgi:hypothetical protein
MAKIIGLKEKQEALKNIQQYLRSIAPLNAFIANANPENEYTISFGNHKAILKCDDKNKINELVRAYKMTIVTNIRDLAKKYEIELDEQDIALMETETV